MSLSDHPKVSVLMPVFNSSGYLSEALQSILRQTFADFEFIIINDGSTDDSADIINKFSDPRIRLMHNGTNLGVVESLNRGLVMARGEYVARMDADDLSRPTRLAKQVAFLDNNPRVGVCGSWVRFIPDNTIWKLPESFDEIKCWQFHSVGVAHPVVMIRRKVFVENGLFYDPRYQHIEDYELWGRALNYMDFANIQEVLLDYRISSEQICSRHGARQLESARSLRAERLKEIGIIPTSAEQELHEAIMNCRLPSDRVYLDQAEQWLLRLESANSAVGKYRKDFFAKRLLAIWFSICANPGSAGICSWKRCRDSLLWSRANTSSWYGIRAFGAWITHKGLWFRHEER